MATGLMAIKDRYQEMLAAHRLAMLAPVYLGMYALIIHAAFLIRFFLHVPAEVRKAFWLTIPAVVVVKAVICVLTAEWKLSVRTAEVREVHKLVLGASVSSLVIYFVNLTAFAGTQFAIPRAVIALDWLLTIGWACLLRIMFTKQREGNAGKVSAITFNTFLLGIFLLSIGLVFCSLSYDPHLGNWFNGDALYPGHFVEDVFVEGNPASGWLFPPAPFVFPDFLCAMFGRLLTSQPALGMFFAGALLFGLVVLSAMYAAAITSRSPKSTLVLMTIAAAMIAVAIGWGGSGTRLRFLFLPAYHTGTYALAILLAALGARVAVDDGTNHPYLIAALAMVGFCAGFSDLMTIAFVSAPLTVALAMGWILNLIRFRRSAIVTGLIWAAPVMGVYCCRETLRLMPFSTFSKVSIASISKATSLVLDGFLNEMAQGRLFLIVSTAWILVSWLWVLAWLYRRARSDSTTADLSPSTRRKILLVICFSLAGPAAICALIAGGNYTLLNDGYEHIIRYLHPFLYTPLLFWPLLIPEAFLEKLAHAFPRRIVAEFGAAAILMLVAAIGGVGLGPYPLHAYVPDYVQKIDQLARERGLRHGVSYYWTARDVNMFTHSEVRVFPVTSEMRYFDWMNNRNWVSGPFKDSRLVPHPEFVVVSPTELYTRADVIRYFGEPAEEIPLDPTGQARMMLIYNRSRDVALRELFFKPSTSWVAGFHPSEQNGESEWRWCGPQGVLVLHNPSGESLLVNMEFECATGNADDAMISIASGLCSRNLTTNHLGTSVSESFSLPPGSHAITFSTNAKPLDAPGDSRQLAFQVRNFQLSIATETDSSGKKSAHRLAAKTGK